MARETIQGVDSSYDLLTPEKARCLKERGVKLYWQALTALPMTGLHQPLNRIVSLRNAKNEGLMTAGYLLVAPGLTGKECVWRARDGVPQDIWEHMSFVAVDVEVDGLTANQVLEACQEVERLDQVAPVYTNFNSWTSKLSPKNSHLLSDEGFLLLNASWDNQPDIDYAKRRFGGWQDAQIVGEQWSGGTVICNQSVDQDTFYLNMVEDEELIDPPEIPEPIVIPSLMKVLVSDGSYTYAEVGIGSSAHHWYIHRIEEVAAMKAAGWHGPFRRKPLGSRLDW